MNIESSMDQVLIEKLTKIIEVNLEKEDFDVKKLAKKAGLSRSKLHRRLHSIKGKSTSKFIREYRLEKALVMLQNNVATASEIAYHVGFSSPQYFSKCFQDFYGYTPGEAKDRNQSLIEDNKETQKEELIGGSQNIIETKKNSRSLFSKRMIWINSFGIVLLSVFFYYFYSNHNNSISSELQNTGGNERSIAIIPFKNLSDNIENQYFADGMMDNILYHLSGIQGLVVKSRQSSERYRDSDKSIIMIGKELGAAYLIEGSVQKQNDRICIILQLINAKNDTHVWAKNYDFELKEVFTVQSTLSKQIAQELNTVLSPVELEHIEKVPTDNLEAYKLYLNGRFFWYQKTKIDLERSIDYYNKALELDSTYALAYSGLADTYLHMAGWGWYPREEGLMKAKKFTLKALSIDNDIAEAHATLGGLLAYGEWNWNEAEKEFKHAISLNPNYATVHEYYSQMLDVMGKSKEARKEINLALSLNPFSASINSLSTIYYYRSDDYKKALSEIKKNQKDFENHPLFIKNSFNVYIQQEKYSEAVSELVRKMKMNEMTAKYCDTIRKVYKDLEIEGVFRWLIDYDLKNSPGGTYFLAQKYAFLGENENALTMLEKCFKERDIWAPYMKGNPYFKKLHNEPRFKAILEKMGLADQ